MKINEYVYIDSKVYRLNDTLLAGGATIGKLLAVGWTIPAMIAVGQLVPAPQPDYTEEPTDNHFTAGDMADAHAAGYASAMARGTLTLKVDVCTVDELISNVLECSQITSTLIRQVAERDAHGKAKYGTSLDRLDLMLTDWLQHQSEELMDGAGYALAAKREAEKLLRTRAAALEVCNAAESVSNMDEFYKAIERLRDTL